MAGNSRALGGMLRPAAIAVLGQCTEQTVVFRASGKVHSNGQSLRSSPYNGRSTSIRGRRPCALPVVRPAVHSSMGWSTEPSALIRRWAEDKCASSRESARMAKFVRCMEPPRGIWKKARARELIPRVTVLTTEPEVEEQEEVTNDTHGQQLSEAGQSAHVARHVALLEVSEMMCGGCAAAVRRILTSDPRVEQAAVNLLTETAAVKLKADVDGEHAQGVAQNLAEMLTSGGFPSRIRGEDDDGMGENGEVGRDIGSRQQDAVRKATSQLAVAWTLVGVCCFGHVAHFLHGLGLHQYTQGPFFDLLHEPLLKGTIALAAVLGPARDLMVDGGKSLMRGTPTMNTLVGLGVTAAFSISAAPLVLPGVGWEASFFEEPVMLLGFVLLGRSLEARARAKAASDIQAIMSLLPASARLVVGSSAQTDMDVESKDEVMAVQVPINQVLPGDAVLVLPGEAIPVDGEVIAGRSTVDESMLTGESLPIVKEKGLMVSAGSINWEGPLTVKARATGKNSLVAKIKRMVEEAQSREAPVQRLADRISGPFVYTVMGLSSATFAFWYLLGTQLFPSVLVSEAAGADGSAFLLSLKLAIDVLVVACPCALGLATPTAVLVGTSLGARQGLLLRGGDVLETVAKVDTVVFDKTGTLTRGKLAVTDIVSTCENTSESDILQLAAALESTTRHPIAAAIVATAKERGVNIQGISVTNAITEAGSGARALVNGEMAAVGTYKWVSSSCCRKEMEKVGGFESVDRHALEEEEEVRRAEKNLLDMFQRRDGSAEIDRGNTVIFVGVGGRGVIGGISLMDSVRPESFETVQRLREMGMKTLIMSGDKRGAVEAIAARVGIDQSDVFCELTPAGKAALISQLRNHNQNACIAMVGDGVNDAPALAASDVGMAMRGGTDAAGEASSVVLMGDRLTQVVEAIELGTRTFSKIRQNLGWALAYNTIGIPLAAGILLPSHDIALSPSVAGAMMAFSSVAVVTNSLLLRVKYKGSSPSSPSSATDKKASALTSASAV